MRLAGTRPAAAGAEPFKGARLRAAIVARWVVAALAGAAVAVFAVLGIDAVASAATSSASPAPVFGPFGNAPSRQPPFLPGNQRGGPPGGGQPPRPTTTTTPTATTTTTTAATVEGAITSIDGDRIGVAETTGSAVVELAGTTAIHDGTTVLRPDQLRTGDRIRSVGTSTAGVLRARTVELIH